MATKKLETIKDKNERRYLIEDAARTLKQFAALRRDKPLMKAARKLLRQEIADSKKVLSQTS